MDNLKVRSFHPTSRNALLFMLLSLVFLVLQKSLQSGLPFLNLAFLKKVTADEWPVLVLGLPAAYTTFRQRRSAPRWFALFTALVTFRALEGLFLDFNKMVLVVLFCQVVISYAFYQLMVWTSTRASFAPNFSTDGLHLPMGRCIPVTVSTGTKESAGRLTNWDEDGAFIWLESPLPPAARVASVRVRWEGHDFHEKGSIVSGTWDETGIGIEWDKSSLENEESWATLMAIFADYGYEPKLLR